ncbi:MAG TPA: carbamoyltransferase [Candidatus Binataceae bacterium]|nr:carbamoyltransferase [Candidatus Binataceae bacterium]
MNLIGISAYYHDSAAALIRDGEIIAAAQEERFSRKKHDPGFPAGALAYCLRAGGITLREVDEVVFYDKPLLKFGRLLETYLASAPRGRASFVAAMPVWLKEKLYLKSLLRRHLSEIAGLTARAVPPLRFTQHHQAHAASAFFPSPFARAGVLCLDGVGEWATTSIWLGEGNRLEPQWEIEFPHSLGLLYSAFTYYTGFKVNSGEYKVMGLAPYGEPKYVQLILDNLIDLKLDGSFRLNPDYFNYATGLTMTNDAFARLFGGPPRQPEARLTQHEMDLARSIQEVTEEVVLRLARTVRDELAVDYLCMAGGVALNCVANGRVLRESGLRDLWVQPAAGDAGGAIGAALSAWHEYHGRPRLAAGDCMSGSYLGPTFNSHEIRSLLDFVGARYECTTEDDLLARVAALLADEKVIGWFQGRMEFGPRALGNRSIIGDARSPRMQSVMNLKIKYRESFRPFAPAVLAERVGDYFELDRPSPYMMIVAPLRRELRIKESRGATELFGINKLNLPRSTLPAITHVDYSARVQTVHRETNPRFHQLLEKFAALTGAAVLVNTSFNVRGEPIVCTPADAYRCFMRTEMDYLAIGNFILDKAAQPRLSPSADHEAWKKEFALD